MYKSTTNIWNETNNYQDLSDDWRGKELFLCGVLSDVCVEQAMSGALKRGAKVLLLTDLCQWQSRQIKDEDSLPPYAVLDKILVALIDEHKTQEQIAAEGFAPELIQRVKRLVEKSAFKREKMAKALDIG